MQLSEIDTTRFGFNVIKLNGGFSLDELNIYAKKNDVKLTIARIPLEDISFINELEKQRFLLMDIQHTLSIESKSFSKSQYKKHPSVRFAEQSDLGTLVSISEKSFVDYGHYSRNHKLDKKKCNLIYQDWIANEVKSINENSVVFVLEQEQSVIGFLSVRLDKKQKIAIGGIGAILPNYRGSNNFKMLIEASLKWSQVNTHKSQQHNVLVDNIAVQKSFLNMGFRPLSSYVTMHCWHRD